jgi:hypothetical protein
MFSGTVLVQDGGGGTRRTAPFPRRGLAALFTAEVTQVVGSPMLSLVIEHKNRAETTWVAADSFASITTEGVYTKNTPDIKEQVRIAATLSGGSNGDIVVLDFRPEGISWRP